MTGGVVGLVLAPEDAARPTFGPLGPMRLELDDAVDIARHDPMFRVRRKGFLASLFG